MMLLKYIVIIKNMYHNINELIDSDKKKLLKKFKKKVKHLYQKVKLS